MTLQSIDMTLEARSNARSAVVDLVVPASMLAVATAVGVASYLHLGLAMELAIAVTLTLFSLFLVGHILLRAADAAERRDARSSRQRATADTQPQRPAQTEAETLDIAPHLHAQQPVDPAASEAVATPSLRPSVVAEAAEPPPLPVDPGLTVVAAPDAAPDAKLDHTHTFDAAATAPDKDAIAAASGWSFRPLELRRPNAVDEQPAPERPDTGHQQQPTVDLPEIASESQAAAPNAEAKRVDDILRRLAAQIRAGQAAAALANPPPQADQRAGGAAEAAGPAAASQVEQATDAKLSTAVDALRSTLEVMRSLDPAPSAPVAAAATDPREAGTTMGATIADSATIRLAAVAKALAAERADVLLEPILALSDQKACHFEVSVRLKDEAGKPLEMVALEDGGRGAGLLPLLDAMSVQHSAGFAMRLERRGREGSVFSSVAGESLESGAFVDQVLQRHAQGLANRLVLTLAQSELRMLGPTQYMSLTKLKDIGFRFALDEVVDLDMDFEVLKATGFDFIKLDAHVFIDGMALGEAHVPASDLYHHFQALGLTMIVDHIDDESIRAQVFECGAVLGKGALFGEPHVIPVAASDDKAAA